MKNNKTNAAKPVQRKITKKECKALALQCQSRSQFSKKFSNSYRTALKNGWLSDVTKHMM